VENGAIAAWRACPRLPKRTPSGRTESATPWWGNARGHQGQHARSGALTTRDGDKLSALAATPLSCVTKIMPKPPSHRAALSAAGPGK
jgi:hypothetical protein